MLIPSVPVKATVWPVAGDNTANIQAAINRVSALTPDKSEFRGAVLIGTGNPRTAGPGRGQPALVTIGGASGWAPREETKQTVLDEYVPVAARSFRVTTARNFKAGDTVIVRRAGNQDWINEIGMNQENRAYSWRPFTIEWDRVVVDVQGNRITIDAPITCAIEQRWGGGEIVKYDDPARIEKVGVENLRGVSEYDQTVRSTEYGNMDRQPYIGDEYYADENHYWNFITINNAKNAWVRNVTALPFANNVVATQRGAKWITTQDCVSHEPISRRMGGRRFTFRLRAAHPGPGLYFRQGTPLIYDGPAYFVRKRIPGLFGDDPVLVERTARAVGIRRLFDNVRAPLTARFWKNISIGWAGANIVFWNCEGPFLIQKPPTAQNYAFAHIGVHSMSFNIPFQDLTKENGHIESWDRHVTPRSLYCTHLGERRGETAVRNIASSGQSA